MTTRDINKGNIETKDIQCWASPGCHDRCRVLADVKDGRILKLRGNRKPIGINKVTGAEIRLFQNCPDRLPHLLKWLNHPDQLMTPLKRIGERGENKWEKVSWDQALDEIADKLKQIKAEYGAESLAINEGTVRSDLYEIRTRFLNLFGNPGNIGCAGTICGCNRHAIKTAILGTGSTRDILGSAKCIVFTGWNITQTRRRVWLNVKERQERGEDVKIIVIDPKETEIAKSADIWLQIRPGTDTALFLSWMNVIIEEGLYDKEFVDLWTFGFDRLRARAAEYTPEKVAGITWIPVEKIRESARMYAQNRPATLCAHGVAPDQIGLNAIRVEQSKTCLRAISGNLRVEDGEVALGPGPIIDG
ncbi:MAG: molybdopterin-dependent oxidoreductase, partial [Dehalococcoidia bacterium]